jgi:hypothetical protein
MKMVVIGNASLIVEACVEEDDCGIVFNVLLKPNTFALFRHKPHSHMEEALITKAVYVENKSNEQDSCEVVLIAETQEDYCLLMNRGEYCRLRDNMFSAPFIGNSKNVISLCSWVPNGS